MHPLSQQVQPEKSREDEGNICTNVFCGQMTTDLQTITGAGKFNSRLVLQTFLDGDLRYTFLYQNRQPPY